MEFGANDWNSTATTLSLTISNLQSVITDIKAGGGIPWLICAPPSNPSGFATVASQAEYRAAIRSLAETNGCPWTDMTILYGGSWASASALNVMGDDRHENTLGCQLLAQAIAEPLLAA